MQCISRVLDCDIAILLLGAIIQPFLLENKFELFK